MPVTAKLSRRFYEKFGDEVTNELVDWLNAVDTSYRQEFRELFAAHFGQLRAEMGQLEARVGAKLEQRLGELRLDQRFAEVRAEVAEVRTEVAQLRAEAAALGRGTATKHDLANLRAELLKWMFLFWLGTIGAVLFMVKL